MSRSTGSHMWTFMLLVGGAAILSVAAVPMFSTPDAPPALVSSQEAPRVAAEPGPMAAAPGELVDARPDPDEDADKDGHLDRFDACPNAAEDYDRFRDDDGCPDEDNDNDGLKDSEDACPDHPENIARSRDRDGCPDVVLPRRSARQFISPGRSVRQTRRGGVLPRRRITMDLYKADVGNVLRLFARESGVNIVFGEEVTGTVTATFTDVPMDEAFSSVLRAAGLAYEVNGEVMLVETPR